jgi:hypothetical protein
VKIMPNKRLPFENIRMLRGGKGKTKTVYRGGKAHTIPSHWTDDDLPKISKPGTVIKKDTASKASRVAEEVADMMTSKFQAGTPFRKIGDEIRARVKKREKARSDRDRVNAMMEEKYPKKSFPANQPSRRKNVRRAVDRRKK